MKLRGRVASRISALSAELTLGGKRGIIRIHCKEAR